MNLLEIPWHELGGLVGLGRPLEFIPNNLVPVVRNTLTGLWKRAVCGNELHVKKALLAATILFIDAGKARSHNIVDKCKRLNADDWSLFTVDSFAGRSDAKSTILSEEDKEAKIISRMYKLLAKGEIGKAADTWFGITAPAERGEQPFEYLQSKHPIRTSNEDELLMREAEESVPPVYLAVDQVSKAIKDLKPGVRYGNDNLSIDIMKQLTKPNEAHKLQLDEFSTALTSFINFICTNATCSPKVRAFVLGGELANVRTAPTKLSPVCMVSLYRKIHEKALQLKHRAFARAHFNSLQLGAGASYGSEKMVHTMRIALETFPQLDYSASDYSDAFQHIHRSSIVSQYQKFLPAHADAKQQALVLSVPLTYVGCPSGIRFIESTIGVPQGAPASSFDFSLGLHPFNQQLDAIASRGDQGGFVICYADDTKAIAPTDNLCEVIGHQIHRGPAQGINLNPKKHLILLGTGSTDSVDEKTRKYVETGIPLNRIRVHPADGGDASVYGDMINGIPVGSPEYVAIQLGLICEKQKRDFFRLGELPDPQLQFCFLNFVLKRRLHHFTR
jgi:hypothetical protein